MTSKTSRQPEVMELLKTCGPVTCSEIAYRLGIHRSSVQFHITRMGKEVHIEDFQAGIRSDGKTMWSAMWVYGPGRNMKQPKIAAVVERTPITVDLTLMPFRSVFAGGVNPWAGMAA